MEPKAQVSDMNLMGLVERMEALVDRKASSKLLRENGAELTRLNFRDNCDALEYRAEIALDRSFTLLMRRIEGLE